MRVPPNDDRVRSGTEAQRFRTDGVCAGQKRQAGRPPYRPRSGTIRIAEDDLQAYLSSCRQEKPATPRKAAAASSEASQALSTPKYIGGDKILARSTERTLVSRAGFRTGDLDVMGVAGTTAPLPRVRIRPYQNGKRRPMPRRSHSPPRRSQTCVSDSRQCAGK